MVIVDVLVHALVYVMKHLFIGFFQSLVVVVVGVVFGAPVDFTLDGLLKAGRLDVARYGDLWFVRFDKYLCGGVGGIIDIPENIEASNAS